MRALGLSLLLLGFIAAACHHNAGTGTDMAGGGVDMSASSCLAGAATCATNGECCSNVCDQATHQCTAAICKAAGGACANAGDCCNLNCVNGSCGTTQCLSDGASCSAGGAQCCSGPDACQNGTCTQLGNGCHTAGNACTTNSDCCSGACDTSTKTCAAPSTISFCTQVGDVCYKDTDCCTSICQVGATGAGTCQALPSSACLVDGTTCTSCNSQNQTTVSKCCSTYCGEYGSTGSTVCQPAGGCRIQGDLCRQDADCCGGASASMCTLPGDGEVKCMIFDSKRGLGTCQAPQGSSCTQGTCIPEGDVCHCQLVDSKGICWDSCPAGETCKPLPSGCSVSGVNANCCGTTGANKMTCRVDSVGVPRCFTVSGCVAAGGACATSADCCGNVCVPDSTGKYVCGGSACVPTAGKCTATADCCPGSGNVCIIPPGQTAGVCGNPTSSPPDGGTTSPDMGSSTCSFAGQQCSPTQPCCGTNTCTAPTGGTCATATGCTCSVPIS